MAHSRIGAVFTSTLMLLLTSAATAVHRAPDGLGQVLLFPYYTTRADQATLYSVVNTTDHVKAVNVRFLEGKGGVATLDFHLYLAPRDTWTGALTDDGVTTRLYSNDQSCTVPQIPAEGVDFKNVAYVGDNYADDSHDRAREGFAQMIEMGTVLSGPNRLGRFALPGDDQDCDALIQSWTLDGTWRLDASQDIRAPGGGLRGTQALIDLSGGRATTMAALALAEFRAFQMHVVPGSLEIGLADARPPVSRVWHAGEVIESTWTGDRIQAVSAVLSTFRMVNEFVTDPVTDSATDWVFTQPTKGLHVPAFGGDHLAPYGMAPISDFGQCQPYNVRFWDREGNQAGEVFFSPPIRFICWVTTIFQLEFEQQVLASQLVANGFVIAESYNGTAEIGFSHQPGMVSDEGHRYIGMPGFGFAITRFSNGLLDQVPHGFGVSSAHSTFSRIETTPTH